MKAKILAVMMLVVGSVFWSCNSDQLIPNYEGEMLAVTADLNQEIVGLKSGEVGIINTGGTQSFPLLHKGEEVGSMDVMYNHNSLIVLFLGNQNYNIDRVQLWVGTDIEEVPSNPVNKPTPGRFPFKNFGFNNFIFLIPQDQIADDYLLSEGNPVLFVAHVEASNRQTGESISTWSEGDTFSPKSNATYTEYTPGTPNIGGGCFPFPAYCGTMVNKAFYLDATNIDGQRIVAKIGENNWLDIGYLSFDSGNIIFNFDQEWMFTTLVEPEVFVTGYNELGTNGQVIYSGIPMSPKPPIYYYFGPVEGYNFYKIELKVQYCF
ncbi:hypothetical protein [Maribellus sediminis]|uniref:hypothetical protein n=1 Tax=Maribellus sediminis TaxID=2696285 RepID=UPI001430D945|nr:hypothetical protein [Maribellus sediminis]